MLNENPEYSFGTVCILGFALFSLFFGAGNLIFPPTIGIASGDKLLFATPGFLLTAVGLPLIGILAVGKADGGIEKIGSKLGAPTAKTLATIIFLIIGPLFAIPRTMATTFELGVLPNIPWLGSWLFSLFFAGLVLLFALKPSSVIKRIGKILTPILAVSLCILIFKGIVSPFDTAKSTGIENPFGHGFKEGYQTMDLMAATIFGVIILRALYAQGTKSKKSRMNAIMKAGIIATIGLGVIYSGLIYLGATTGGFADTPTRTELILIISRRLLGTEGGIILSVAVSVACLTTAIGLTVACSDYFHKVLRSRIRYDTLCIGTVIISMVLANVGVEMIVKLALPPLVALYPILIILCVFTLIGRDRIKNKNIWRGAVVGALCVSVLQAIDAAGIEIKLVQSITLKLPLYNQGLGWLVPAIVVGSFAAFTGRSKVLHKPTRMDINYNSLTRSVKEIESRMLEDIERIPKKNDINAELDFLHESIDNGIKVFVDGMTDCPRRGKVSAVMLKNEKSCRNENCLK